jgi:hypothetical protein
MREEGKARTDPKPQVLDHDPLGIPALCNPTPLS